jgi:hypothetical protein
MFVDGPRWRFGLEEGLGALAASGEFWGANLWVAIRQMAWVSAEYAGASGWADR